MSFRITISPKEQAAGRFVSRVRRGLQKALAEEAQKRGLTQSDLARAIGVNRSVISRELRGHKDLSLSRVAELAWALGRRPVFELVEAVPAQAATSPEPEEASALKV
jgi:transcriptional regulator with XRE-family HTH domain